MTYREYANQRANEIDLFVATFIPEKRELMEVSSKFLRENTKMDKVNERLKSQIEKILGREVHWAELDWIAQIMVSMVTVDLTDDIDLTEIMKRGLRLFGVPEEELDDLTSDLTNLMNDITSKA